MDSKKSTPTPSDVPLDRATPYRTCDRLAVCYRNRAHNSFIGLPYVVWQEFMLEQFKAPSNNEGVDCPRECGQYPDATPLEVTGVLRWLEDQRQGASIGTKRVLWFYPKH